MKIYIKITRLRGIHLSTEPLNPSEKVQKSGSVRTTYPRIVVISRDQMPWTSKGMGSAGPCSSEPKNVTLHADGVVRWWSKAGVE